MKKRKVIGIGALCAMLGLSGCDVFGTTCVHDWSAWEITEKPTCVDRGLRERYCFNCGREQTRTVAVDPIEGHSWKADTLNDKEATCTRKGIHGSKYCEYCNSRQKGTETEYSDHQWLDIQDPNDPSYKAATCEEAGSYQKKCIVCETTEEITIPALEHLAGPIEYANPDDKLGVVHCTRAGCGKFLAYQLDVEKATGYHSPKVRMSGMSGESNNKAEWDISSCIDSVIPSGTYDIWLEAAMPDAANGNRKMYNMARTDLRVDGDEDANESQGQPDKANESAYRYFVKLDATNYYPQTKESFSDLNIGVGVNNPKFFKFIEGVNVNKESTTFSLIHGDIGYPLYIKSVRLIPQEHNISPRTEQPANGRVGYDWEQCSCGYRKITIKANDVNKEVSGSMSESNGLVKLDANGDSVKYKINIDESVTGSLFMVGRQAVADMDKTPFNITVKNNNEEVSGDWVDKKSSDFLKVDSNPTIDGYSEEGRILLGEVTILGNKDGGTNELVITRTGNYNIAMSEIVIEGRPTGHIHNFTHDEDNDVAPTCKTNKQEKWVCSCGQYETRTIPNTMLAHELYEYEPSHIEPSCDNEGLIVKKCSRPGCTYYETITLPRTHDMINVNAPDGAAYTLKECSKCHNAKEATWMLAQEMIEDYVGGEYVQTSATAKEGKTSTGEDFSVFKFDTAKRRVKLTYRYDGTEYKKAKFSMFATTKASNIASCQPYVQTIGQESNPEKKFVINVNGDDVSIPGADRNKNIGDIGLENVNSQLNDGGLLANPMWLEYCEVELTPNSTNTIIIEAPTAAKYSMYLGGFRISY